MKITKENYEFLMFELLEGNLNESDKNILMEQINKDAFYQREWTLMQHSIVIPDGAVNMLNKKSLLKPEGRIIAFISFNAFAKIAASLLLIGTVGWWYYTYKNQTTVVYNPKNEVIKAPEIKVAETPIENNLKQIRGENRKRFVMTEKDKNITPENSISKIELNKDSSLPVNLPEILFIKPLGNQGIAYKITHDEVLPSGNLNIEKPKAKELNRIEQMIVQADKIKTTAQDYWSDIPNLKLKVTPKFKNHNRSIGFELKGETIYANALVEIK